MNINSLVKILTTIAVLVIAASISYYYVIFLPSYKESKLDSVSQSEQKEQSVEENKTLINTNASREAYEDLKYSLDHHFIACFSTKKLSCTDGVCEELEPITFWLLTGTRSDGTISRCDHQGCDTYDAIAQQSGLYENVQPKEPQGFIFKRQVLDIFGNPASPQEFVDIASIGLTTVISTGYCTEEI